MPTNYKWFWKFNDLPEIFQLTRPTDQQTSRPADQQTSRL